MLELSSTRKNKVNLADYHCQEDIQNRILMSDFTTFDIEVLEEILYSPLKASFKKLIRTLGCQEDELLASLHKLSSTGLLCLNEDLILVDKEKRKYFEFEIQRFDSDFKPDMEFLQGLLRKVPIPVLPTWYSIPRTSNNIFESIVEKYLLTPHIFQRYLAELNFANPTLNAMLQDVFSAPDFKVSSSDLISKYNLKRKDFEEMMLLLEFNFACCTCYEKEADHWLEFIAPFHEWHEYLRFFQATEPPPVNGSIQRKQMSDFAFIEEMSELLHQASKQPFAAPQTPALEKLCLTKLATYQDGILKPLEAASSWLDSSLENRALYLYRHPYNRILSFNGGERYVREAEKSIKRVLHGSWVYFEDFFKGVLVPLNEQSVVMLKKFGKNWRYTLPVYTEEEKNLVKATIFEWLYEFGMVAIGKCEGKDCFSVTAFGRFFFDD